MTQPDRSAWHDRAATDTLGPSPSGDAGTSRHSDPALPNARIFRDREGLPVTYDVAICKKMEQAKADAISVLSHELLSPLTLIKGYTATLLELRDAITQEQQEKYLRGIEAASNRLVRLLETLRDITCLEETHSLVTQPINIYDLLRTAAAEVQAQTTKHIIKLRPSARLPRARLDPEKIIQVLNNLLANAVKYSPQGGDIEIGVQMVSDGAELEGLSAGAPEIALPALVVGVADSGIGIPEADLELDLREVLPRQQRRDARYRRGRPRPLHLQDHRGSPRRPYLGRQPRPGRRHLELLPAP